MYMWPAVTVGLFSLAHLVMISIATKTGIGLADGDKKIETTSKEGQRDREMCTSHACTVLYNSVFKTDFDFYMFGVSKD